LEFGTAYSAPQQIFSVPNDGIGNTLVLNWPDRYQVLEIPKTDKSKSVWTFFSRFGPDWPCHSPDTDIDQLRWRLF
jgi:hypothetical protein